jgi:hypothetical protein
MAVAGLRDAGLLNRGETTPRTFALPEMPADVVAVKDRGGRTWRRYEPGDDFWVNDGSIVGHSSIQLIATRGPLTEVVDSS